MTQTFTLIPHSSISTSVQTCSQVHWDVSLDQSRGRGTAISSMTGTCNWYWSSMKKIRWKTEKVIIRRYRTIIKGAVPCSSFYPGVWHVTFICCFTKEFLEISGFFFSPHRQICVLYVLCHSSLDLWTSMLQWGTKPQFSMWNVVGFLEWVLLAVGTSRPCKGLKIIQPPRSTFLFVCCSLPNVSLVYCYEEGHHRLQKSPEYRVLATRNRVIKEKAVILFLLQCEVIVSVYAHSSWRRKTKKPWSHPECKSYSQGDFLVPQGACMEKNYCTW